ncbi:MAG TPA: glycosyltransferase [Candidatus Polarisedimenticolia bacterium]|nr:glycosyltransferase [Candidatus Polarisedimenticolia bacterium]
MARKDDTAGRLEASTGPSEGEARLCAGILEMLAAHPVEEWIPSGPPALPPLADWIETLGGERDLVEILRAAGSDAGPPAAEPPRLILLTDPLRWLDPRQMIERAAARLAPDGWLLLLPRGARQDDIEGLAATLGSIPTLRFRRLWNGGDGALLGAKRPGAPPRLVLFPDAVGACLQIRTLGPLERLEARGEIRLTLLGDADDETVLAGADLLVLQRCGGLPAARLLLTARRLGLPVVIDLDDDLFKVPWFNPGALTYRQFGTTLLLRALLSGADRVIVSTPRLRDEMLRHNADVVTLHNLVDTNLFVRPAAVEGGGAAATRFAAPEAVTFAYFGTRTHREDFRPILAPLRRLLLESEGRVRAVFLGHLPEELRRLPHVRYLGWFGGYHNAALALGRAGADVGLAPLLDLDFNRSKSAIKYLEYAACGLPAIFSDAEAYRRFIRHGENGLLVREHTEEAWDEAMRSMIENPAARRRMAETAWREVRGAHSIEARLPELLALYREVLERPRPVSGAQDTFAMGGRPAPAAGAEEERSAPALSVIVRLDDDPGRSLAVLASVCEELAPGAQVIVLTGSEDLAALLRLSRLVPVILERPDSDEEGPSGAARALALARAPAILYLDGRCRFPPALATDLLRDLAPDVAAIGPRLMRGLDAPAPAAEGATLRPVRWLEPYCLLFRREVILALGGIEDRLLWEDAGTDLCLRATGRGLRLLLAEKRQVAVGAGIEARAGAAARRRSRERLGKRPGGLPPAGAEGDEALRFFGAGRERLDVWLFARPESTYLHECLARLERHTDLPYRLHLLHPAGETASARLARHYGGESRPHGAAGRPLVATLLEIPDSTHAVLLHDGVMATSGWLREMLRVALVSGRPIVAPRSNDGCPEQRLRFDRAISLDRLDEVAARAIRERDGDVLRAEGCGTFCLLLDLQALRRLAREGIDVAGADLQALLRRFGPVVADRAYVHLLSHPPEAHDLGAWPGGPFDRSLGPLEAAAALPATRPELREIVARLQPLREALRENPGDAALLARVGALYLKSGEIESGMSLLERARKVDPFCREIRTAHRGALALLGRLAGRVGDAR